MVNGWTYIVHILNLMTRLDDNLLFHKNMHILSQFHHYTSMFNCLERILSVKLCLKKTFIPISFEDNTGTQCLQHDQAVSYF